MWGWRVEGERRSGQIYFGPVRNILAYFLDFSRVFFNEVSTIVCLSTSVLVSSPNWNCLSVDACARSSPHCLSVDEWQWQCFHWIVYLSVDERARYLVLSDFTELCRCRQVKVCSNDFTVRRPYHFLFQEWMSKIGGKKRGTSRHRTVRHPPPACHCEKREVMCDHSWYICIWTDYWHKVTYYYCVFYIVRTLCMGECSVFSSSPPRFSPFISMTDDDDDNIIMRWNDNDEKAGRMTPEHQTALCSSID